MGLFERMKGIGYRPGTVHVPDDKQIPQARRRFNFSGLVQGAGFRWQTKTLAAQLGLTGWVGNESDGTVTAELQSGESSVGEFLRATQATSRFDMTDVQIENLSISAGGNDVHCAVLREWTIPVHSLDFSSSALGSSKFTFA